MLAMWIMAPVTLPVPVLRELVGERFAVSEFATSLFMSVNMIGALLMAPLAGAFSDRWGRKRSLLVAALAADGICFFALASPVPFWGFLAIYYWAEKENPGSFAGYSRRLHRVCRRFSHPSPGPLAQ